MHEFVKMLTAETKNGAVVRKHLGYSHIPQHLAEEVNSFCRDYLNPYLNYHRPCLFPEETKGSKGKIRKRYPRRLVMTPLEKLLSLEDCGKYLKEGVTVEGLLGKAGQCTDNEAAAKLAAAKRGLFQSVSRRSCNRRLSLPGKDPFRLIPQLEKSAVRFIDVAGS